MEPNLNNQVSQKVIPTTKDAIVYIGILISLIVSVWNIINVVFEAINKAFPDALNNNYNYIYSFDSLRWSISILIVIFPIYIIISHVAARDIEKDLSKKDLGIRKFTLFGALFISGISIIGSLITTIYFFLGGETSPRFFLKVLFVILVSIIISSYYYYLTKRDYTQKSFIPNMFAIVSVVLVLGSVIWSISIIGTPSDVRKQKLDTQRVTTLTAISNQVLTEYKNNRELPKSLSDIKIKLGYGTSVVDPVTNEEYEYKVIDNGLYDNSATFVTNVTNVANCNYLLSGCEVIQKPAIFKLCANFESKSDTMKNVNNYYDNRNSQMNDHVVGRNCYIGTITDKVFKGTEYNFMTKE